MSVIIPLAIIEPDVIMREGLVQILKKRPIKIVGAWPSQDDVLSGVLDSGELSIILVSALSADVLEPEDSQRLKARFPRARIVLLVRNFTASIAAKAAAAQVDGALLRSYAPTNLVKSLELIALGQGVFPMPIVTSNTHSAPLQQSQMSLDKLSARERQVIQELAEGLSNKDIASRLQITDATVKVHVKSILRKIGASNRTEAALFARSLGLGGLERRDPEAT